MQRGDGQMAKKKTKDWGMLDGIMMELYYQHIEGAEMPQEDPEEEAIGLDMYKAGFEAARKILLRMIFGHEVEPPHSIPALESPGRGIAMLGS